MNLLPAYGSFFELEQGALWCERVSAGVHRETARRPVDALAEEAAQVQRLLRAR